jgi:hypothetical protein
MRRGYESKLVISKSGNLVAFATGSDHCTEHECGAKPLMSALTDSGISEEWVLAELRNGKTPVYPDILESKRISSFPQQLQFIVTEGEVPEAWLGYDRRPLTDYSNELQFHDLRDQGRVQEHDPDVAGAWDDGSFAIRVRGKKYVKALKAFHQSLLAGKVAFAGTFFKRDGDRLGGVVLAELTKVSDDDRKAVKVAQEKMESGLRLKARSEADGLTRALAEAFGRYVGFVWPVWKDEVDGEIAYAMNPSYNIDADYYGPYTKEQLLEWAQAKCSYHLSPEYRKAA